MRGYASVIVAAVVTVAAVVGASVLLGGLGVADVQQGSRDVAGWLLTRGLTIVLIVASSAALLRAARLGIGALQQRVGHGLSDRDLEWERRASTLGGLLRRVVTVAVWFVAVMMVLRELTIDVLPLLTGAGIAGLAIGFGAQNLVRDVISGFFLILEDQVRVGDSARINGVAGSIERVNLRTIVLRDAEGAVHVFPNGTVTALANLSKQFAYATVDVRVTYDENLDRVFGTLREVGSSMQDDAQWKAILLEAIDIRGVESIDNGFVTIRARFKTLPLAQAKVAAELRRRLVSLLAGRGIKPYAS